MSSPRQPQSHLDAKAAHCQVNPIDCSSIECNRLSSWFLGKRRDGGEKLIGEGLKTVRKAGRLSHEAFSDVSGRTFQSSLERDLKSPTLNKLAELCEVMEIHPVRLLALAYSGNDSKKADLLVRHELELLAQTNDK